MQLITHMALLLVLTAWLLPAQSTSDKIRAGESGNAVGPELGSKPGSMLKIVKLKGMLSKVDLEKRTVTITPNKKETELELGFPQPAGREQIKASKKAQKVLGRKKLRLEELKAGSKVQLQYYPVLGQVMELIIQEPPG